MENRVKTKVRFTEEGVKNVKDWVDIDLKGFVKVLCSTQVQLEQLCKQTQYKPIIDKTASTVDYLCRDFKAMADGVIDKWLNDDTKNGTNFVALARRFECGEESEEAARKLDQFVYDRIQDFWNEDFPLEPVEVPSTLTEICSQEKLDECMVIYATSAQNLQNQADNLQMYLNNQRMEDTYDNLMMGAVYAPLAAVAEALVKGLQNAAAGIEGADKEILEKKSVSSVAAGTYSKEQVDKIKASQLDVFSMYKSVD